MLAISTTQGFSLANSLIKKLYSVADESPENDYRDDPDSDKKTDAEHQLISTESINQNLDFDKNLGEGGEAVKKEIESR